MNGNRILFPFFAPPPPEDVPYRFSSSDNSCSPPDGGGDGGDGGSCGNGFCYGGQMGALPTPGARVDYCGGVATWLGTPPCTATP